jgi:hypothetical protein
MNLKKFLCVFLLFSPYALAEWAELGSSPDDEYRNFVDLSTLKRVNGNVRIWSMMDYKKPHKWGQITYSSSKSYEEIDCIAETTATIAGTGYSGNMGNGNPVYTFIPRTHSPVVPESIGAYMKNFICSLENLRKK